MGEQSHISMDFDHVRLFQCYSVIQFSNHEILQVPVCFSNVAMKIMQIITATLENYITFTVNLENGRQDGKQSQPEQWIQGVLNSDDHSSSFPDMSKKVSSLPNIMNADIKLASSM